MFFFSIQDRKKMKKLQSHSEIKWVFGVQISSCHGQIWSFPVQESMTSSKFATPPPPLKLEGLQQRQRRLNSRGRIWVKNKINPRVPWYKKTKQHDAGDFTTAFTGSRSRKCCSSRGNVVWFSSHSENSLTHRVFFNFRVGRLCSDAAPELSRGYFIFYWKLKCNVNFLFYYW